ncbi:MAG TPA: GNAT family N-acetyltransferase [Solirubrobacteraceae bacterium]|nr:GNAT family N-acetyltransferase [Solirubrobacteraceae bacterium]
MDGRHGLELSGRRAPRVEGAPSCAVTSSACSGEELRTIHGVGRWERLNPTHAELAFVIEDAYQGQGLGRKLIEATIERAHQEGFTRLLTDMLPSNYRMRRLARDYDLLVAEL